MGQQLATASAVNFTICHCRSLVKRAVPVDMIRHTPTHCNVHMYKKVAGDRPFALFKSFLRLAVSRYVMLVVESDKGGGGTSADDG